MDFLASMRPPLNAGENFSVGDAENADLYASMRPPLNAGENGTDAIFIADDDGRFNEAPAERGGELAEQAQRHCHLARFNEAPAERGGELNRSVTLSQHGVASMRPPLNAGENAGGTACEDRPTSCFNEAPAERGGEPSPSRHATAVSNLLQ